MTPTRARNLTACLLLALTAQQTSSGCSLPDTDKALGTDDLEDELDDLDDLDVGGDLSAQIDKILHELFPDLSDAELADARASFDLNDLLALKDELEAARRAAKEFSDNLFISAEEAVAQRKEDLTPHNDGFPSGLASVGQLCTYDSGSGSGAIQLSGVFDGKDAVLLDQGGITLSIDGAQQDFSLSCLAGDSTVDVVFLIDITGSMANVIDSVRDSVVNFVDIIEASGVRGTVSAVSFQDTVGVNRTFQERAPRSGFERSPFFAPVSLSDATQVDALRSFVNRLEANLGADAPENLAGAVDFARNNVIGLMASGEPNVIGDGREDPPDTEAFPALTSDRQVFVVLTDVGFHGDDQDERNSSLDPAFVPRDRGEILTTLHQTGTTVHVSDPSWIDESVADGADYVDADYWAMHTGGVGADVVEGYSLVDLELVVVAEETGLLDITLDKILQTSCTIEFEAELTAQSEVSLSLEANGKSVTAGVELELF